MAALATLFVGAHAMAAPTNEEDEEKATTANTAARQRFAEGNDRYARGDYDGAIESFKAAIAADPKLPGPYRNLGLAYRALNRCAEALPNYEKYLELKPESRFTDRVRREIDLCRVKLGQAPLPPRPSAPSTGPGTGHAEPQSILHVAANLIGGEATDEATVKIDDLVRGATPLTIPVTPGVHKVQLARVGFETVSATVEIGPGERRDVELTMNKLALVEHQIAYADQLAQPPRPSYRKYAWIMLGVAAGSAAVGAGLGIAESQKYGQAAAAIKSQTDRATIDRLHADGSNYAVGAYLGLGVGGAALLASSILFIVDGSRKETHEVQRYVLAPLIGPQGGGLVATVRLP
jgi:tetratricopeptide (TPR) repeat protein